MFGSKFTLTILAPTKGRSVRVSLEYKTFTSTNKGGI